MYVLLGTLALARQPRVHAIHTCWERWQENPTWLMPSKQSLAREPHVGAIHNRWQRWQKTRALLCAIVGNVDSVGNKIINEYIQNQSVPRSYSILNQRSC